MPSTLKVVGQPLTPSGTPGQAKDSPSRVSSPPQIRNWKDPKNPGQPLPGAGSLARDLQSLSDKINAINTTLSTATPNIQQILIVDQQTGQVIAGIGNITHDGIIYTNWFRELHAGDFILTNNPALSVFNVNLDGSVSIGDNGWIDCHDPFGGNAAWIGTQYDTLAITGAADNGAGLIRLTVPNHNFATGNAGVHVLNMQFAGVTNATGLWTLTVIDASHVDLQNSVFAGSFALPPATGGIPTMMPVIDRFLQVTGCIQTPAGTTIRLLFGAATGYETGTAVTVAGSFGVPNAIGQWIVSIPPTLAVTGAVDNGAGLIRLTVPGGNFKTGDIHVQVLNVGGVPNASGFWTITAISPTVIDLQGSFFTGTYTSGGTATFTHANLVDLAENVYTGLPSVFAGAYTSGGTCLEYYAGMLAETIAIGQSFASYKLRAFPSGALNINNANITLSSSVGQIILNPNTTQISLTNFANLSEIVLDATVPSLTFFDQTGTPQVTLEILQEAPIQVTAITIASPAVFTVPGNTYIQGDTVLVTGATVNRNLLGYRIVENVNTLLNQFTLTDLAGNPINTSAPETGIVFTARYYAGLLAQTLALGGSWSAFRLRFFADGRLVINNASIENPVISGGTATFTTFTSVGGTAPNTVTLTIMNGLLTIAGAGTAVGTGIGTMDQLQITGQTPAPTAPASGAAKIYYDTGGSPGLFYNLGGAGWTALSGIAQTITTPTVALQVNGSSTGIIGTFTCSCVQTGKNVLLSVAISLTNKGSGSGAVTLLFSGLPVPAMAGTAIVSDLMNMVVLTSSVDAYLPASVSEIFLSQTGATGSVALADTNISNSSAFTFVLSYQST